LDLAFQHAGVSMQVSMNLGSMDLWALHVTAANAPDRRPGAPLASHGHEGPGEAVAGALVEQGSTGKHAAQDAQDQPRRLGVVKLPK